MPTPPKPPAKPKPLPKPEPEARPRDREATETAIVEAARTILARQGFPALNIRAVAQEAGVDRKLIYRYFGDLDGVLARLGADTQAWLGDAQARAKDAPPAHDYADAVATALKAYGDNLAKDDTLLGILAWELAEPNQALNALDAARAKSMMGAMAAARGTHAPPAGVDAPAVIAVAISALHYLALKRRAAGRFSGIALDDVGTARVVAVIQSMLQTQLR